MDSKDVFDQNSVIGYIFSDRVSLLSVGCSTDSPSWNVGPRQDGSWQSFPPSRVSLLRDGLVMNNYSFRNTLY